MEPTSDRQTLTAAIAAALTGYNGWTVEWPNHDTAKLSTTDGRALTLYFYGHAPDERIEVDGCYPWRVRADGGHEAPDLRMNDTRPKMTVSASKPPMAIAADIKRRLMTDYGVLYDTVVARHKETTDYEQRTAKNKRHLAEATDGTVVERGGLRWEKLPATGYVWEVQVGGDHADMDVRGVPIDVAIAVINLVHGRTKP